MNKAAVEEFGRSVDVDPSAALTQLPGVLEILETDMERAEVLRIASLAARATNDVSKALELSTSALELAGLPDDRVLRTNLELTHAYNLFLSGAAQDALERVEALDPEGDDLLAARISFQLGTLLARMGSSRRAAEAFAAAEPRAQRADQPPLVAMIHKNRGMLAAQNNEHMEAQLHFKQALTLFEQLGIDYEVAFARHALAVASAKAGDYPTAFRYFDESSTDIARVSGADFESRRDYCEALLSVGLYTRAARAAAEAADSCIEAGLLADAAEIMLLEASAWLSADELDVAEARARRAAKMFERQGRQSWEAAAQLVVLSVADRRGDPVGPERFDDLRTRLSEGGMRRQAIEAEMSSAAALLRQGDVARTGRVTNDMAELANNFSPDLRLRHLSLRAALAERRGNVQLALGEADRGFEILEAAQQAVGSGELRAGLHRHGRELGEIAVRNARRTGTAEDLFKWFERRALVASTPSPLRAGSTGSRLAAPATPGHTIVRVASSSFCLDHPDVTFLLLARVDGGLLQAVAARRETVLVADLGPVASITSLLRALGADQRRWALDRSQASPQRVLKALELLDRRLLPSAIREILGGAVVVVPAPELFELPWSSLPTMAGRAVSISTSITSWSMKARPAPMETRVLIAGPGVDGAMNEVQAIRQPSDVVLSGDAATAEAVLAAIGGGDAVHIVAHGRSERENPLFSSLSLADGPLTAYQLAELSAPPRLVTLSSCEVGSSSTAEETLMLGMVTGLLHSGVSTVIASRLPVPDTPLVAAMFARFYDDVEVSSPASAWRSLLDLVRSEGDDDMAIAMSCFSLFGRG